MDLHRRQIMQLMARGRHANCCPPVVASDSARISALLSRYVATSQLGRCSEGRCQFDSKLLLDLSGFHQLDVPLDRCAVATAAKSSCLSHKCTSSCTSPSPSLRRRQAAAKTPRRVAFLDDDDSLAADQLTPLGARSAKTPRRDSPGSFHPVEPGLTPAPAVLQPRRSAARPTIADLSDSASVRATQTVTETPNGSIDRPKRYSPDTSTSSPDQPSTSHANTAFLGEQSAADECVALFHSAIPDIVFRQPPAVYTSNLQPVLGELDARADYRHCEEHVVEITMVEASVVPLCSDVDTFTDTIDTRKPCFFVERSADDGWFAIRLIFDPLAPLNRKAANKAWHSYNKFIPSLALGKKDTRSKKVCRAGICNTRSTGSFICGWLNTRQPRADQYEPMPGLNIFKGTQDSQATNQNLLKCALLATLNESTRRLTHYLPSVAREMRRRGKRTARIGESVFSGVCLAPDTPTHPHIDDRDHPASCGVIQYLMIPDYERFFILHKWRAVSPLPPLCKQFANFAIRVKHGDRVLLNSSQFYHSSSAQPDGDSTHPSCIAVVAFQHILATKFEPAVAAADEPNKPASSSQGAVLGCSAGQVSVEALRSDEAAESADPLAANADRLLSIEAAESTEAVSANADQLLSIDA